MEEEPCWPTVTITKLSDESYQEFHTLRYLGEYVESLCDFQLSVKEATKIMSKGAEFLLKNS